MNFKRICCLIAISILLLTAAQSFSQEEMRYVDNSAFDRSLRGPSVFDHDAHNQSAGLDECAQCHHLYEDGRLVKGESSEDQSCSECHPADGSGSNSSLRRAFHLSCKGCHLKRADGPIMCAECHQSAGGAPSADKREAE